MESKSYNPLLSIKLLLQPLIGGVKLNFSEIEKIFSAAGVKSSRRTIQRLFELLRSDYGIQIKYNKTKNYYFLPEETIPIAKKFLELNQLAEQQDWIQHVQAVHLNYLVVENSQFNYINLTTLLDAAWKEQVCVLTTISNEKLEVKPYLIKSYKKQYHLFYLSNDDLLNVVRFEMIESVVMLKKTFKRNEAINKKIEGHYGVDLGEKSLQEDIVLEIKNDLAETFLISPLHRSQQLIERKKNNTIFSYKMSYGEQLASFIISQKGNISVQSPSHLKGMIYKLTKRLYKKHKP